MGIESRSIEGFCLRQDISKTTYFKLRRQERGPKEIRLGGKITISAAAEDAWVKQRENPSPAEAREIEKLAAIRVENAKKAAAASVASPNHITKQRAANAKRRRG